MWQHRVDVPLVSLKTFIFYVWFNFLGCLDAILRNIFEEWQSLVFSQSIGIQVIELFQSIVNMKNL